MEGRKIPRRCAVPDGALALACPPCPPVAWRGCEGGHSASRAASTTPAKVVSGREDARGTPLCVLYMRLFPLRFRVSVLRDH